MGSMKKLQQIAIIGTLGVAALTACTTTKPKTLYQRANNIFGDQNNFEFYHCADGVEYITLHKFNARMEAYAQMLEKPKRKEHPTQAQSPISFNSMKRVLKRADTNHDFIVTQNELEALAKKIYNEE